MFHTIVAVVQGTKIIKNTNRVQPMWLYAFNYDNFKSCVFKYGNLKNHLKTHSADMKYNYNQSDYASVEAGSLRAH